MFQFFSNIVKNIEVDVFFKKSPKNRIVKNWKTSHREKHRIVKKSEHRPPLVRDEVEIGLTESWLINATKDVIKVSLLLGCDLLQENFTLTSNHIHHSPLGRVIRVQVQVTHEDRRTHSVFTQPNGLAVQRR